VLASTTGKICYKEWCRYVRCKAKLVKTYPAIKVGRDTEHCIPAPVEQDLRNLRGDTEQCF
jgi:hypothetical protein